MPAAAITAYAGTYDRQRVLSAGFDSYLAKPIQPAEIVATVRSLWNTASQLS
jgi:CheY-like chemotaxis protein